MSTRRQRQVAELVHRELSLLLLHDVRDPRLEGVTITEVRVTPDLLLARIFYTLLDDDAEVAEAQLGLERASGFLRSQLAARVRLRLVPELVFMHDTSAAYGQHIDELLEQIEREQSSRQDAAHTDQAPDDQDTDEEART